MSCAGGLADKAAGAGIDIISNGILNWNNTKVEEITVEFPTGSFTETKQEFSIFNPFTWGESKAREQHFFKCYFVDVIYGERYNFYSISIDPTIVQGEKYEHGDVSFRLKPNEFKGKDIEREFTIYDSEGNPTLVSYIETKTIRKFKIQKQPIIIQREVSK
jgi:hypothetical protein